MMRVCVAGAGPAGLAAAIFAAGAGASVVLVEKNIQCGVKLLATGGGHCNVTNTRPETEWPSLFGKNGRFITPALSYMPRSRLEAWFVELGQPLCCLDGRHYFPQSNSAKAVRDALLAEAERKGVKILYTDRALEITHRDGMVTGLSTDNGPVSCDRLILALGGRSYPATGSSWDGAAMAAAIGHKVSPPYPGLVGLTVDNLDSSLAGLVVPDAVVSVKFKGSGVIRGRGELLCTHTGISGPAVLDISGRIAEGLERGGKVTIAISWCGEDSPSLWRERMKQWKNSKGGTTPAALLKEYLPQRLARWLCRDSGIGEEVPVSRLSAGEVERLSEGLGGFQACVSGTQGWEKAMVTRGGIDVRQINPKSMESRVLGGLYFAGEMVDMDGPCGGYNLHWAFASGALAGVSAASGNGVVKR